MSGMNTLVHRQGALHASAPALVSESHLMQRSPASAAVVSAVSFAQQRAAALASNALAFGGSARDAFMQGLPSLQTALRIPEQLAFHVAESIAGPIEPRTPYQAQLKNSPSAAGLAAQSARQFVDDIARMAKGVTQSAHTVMYAGVTQLAGIEPRTAEQHVHAQQLKEFNKALANLAWGQTPAGLRWVDFNPFVENIPVATGLGAAFAGMVSKKNLAYGPLQWVGSKTTVAQVFETKNNQIEIVLGKKKVATYDLKSEELSISDLRWPAPEINTVGAILNGRGLEVVSVKGHINPHQVLPGSSAWQGLDSNGRLAQKMLRAVGEQGNLRHGSFLVLADFHEYMQRLPAGQLINPFFIQDLKFGSKTKAGKAVEVDMNRLRPGVSPENVYLNMSLGDKFVSESMYGVLTDFTSSMFKSKPRS